MKKNIIPFEYKKYISENLNPKFALYIALFENITIIIWLFVNNASVSVLVKYIVMIMIFKVTPLFLVIDDVVKMPYDIIPLSVLFLIYIIFLYAYNETPYKIYKVSNDFLFKGENKTPFFETTQWIYETIIKGNKR